MARFASPHWTAAVPLKNFRLVSSWHEVCMGWLGASIAG